MLFTDKVELQIEPFIRCPAHHNILYSEIRPTEFRRFFESETCFIMCIMG